MSSKTLEFTIEATCGRKARTGKLKLPHSTVQTPVFMPVGTCGTIKGLRSKTVQNKIGCEIILGNTYHLSQRPGIDTLEKVGGLHKFMNWENSILTDSGGFQFVSLSSLCDIFEEGVKFQSPHDGIEMFLTPEKSIHIQNVIGSDIMMQLDDVVSSLTTGPRVEEAMKRSIRWLDRCIKAHKRPNEQNLFAIIQGGLDEKLRRQCCEAMIKRKTNGYAIGGLSGGEEKSHFWRMVDVSTDELNKVPNKPRYCMGVGYPVDIVVCCALGVDMFDCVFPCRTARFGTVLTKDGMIKTKAKKFKFDYQTISDTKTIVNDYYTRSFYQNAKMTSPTASSNLTCHNLDYMMDLMKQIRKAIKANKYEEFVQKFMLEQYPDKKYPTWVINALKKVEIELL